MAYKLFYDSLPLVMNKSLGFFIVCFINFIFPTYQSSNYICILFFSHDLFYVSCIPGFISFFISVGVIIYLSIIYTQHNSIHPQNPSPMLGQQGREHIARIVRNKIPWLKEVGHFQIRYSIQQNNLTFTMGNSSVRIPPLLYS